MKRIAIAALAAFISISAANAEMSDSRMYLATMAVKATAMIASEFERCGVDSSRMPNTMMDWASNSCHASADQLTELRGVYSKELKDQVANLKRQSDRCRWSPEQTETEFQENLSTIVSFAESQCRN
jgi:hypothetical protein